MIRGERTLEIDRTTPDVNTRLKPHREYSHDCRTMARNTEIALDLCNVGRSGLMSRTIANRQGLGLVVIVYDERPGQRGLEAQLIGDQKTPSTIRVT